MVIAPLMAEVLNLQPSYSSSNSDKMRRRGLLIRDSIPEAVSSIKVELAEKLQVDLNDLLIEGRDGTGRFEVRGSLGQIFFEESIAECDGWLVCGAALQEKWFRCLPLFGPRLHSVCEWCACCASGR